MSNAPVAQLDRALAFGARRWRFDSSQAYLFLLCRNYRKT